MKTWIEWVEPYVDSMPVYMRVSAETAIAAARRLHDYDTDERALDDFIVIHWATIRTEEDNEEVHTSHG